MTMVTESVGEATDVYQPLDHAQNEIRVLIVEPGEGDEPIRGRLNKTALASDPCAEYETISYCWGDATKRAKIWVDGCPMNVTANAASALQRLRLQDRERSLWIDGICINQADLDEKAKQVASMGLVYQHGTSNLIFLGNGEGGLAEKVTVALAAATTNIDQLLMHCSREERKLLDRYQLLDHGCRSPMGSESLVVLEPLFSLPWFTRLWVLQEISLARQNQCFLGNLSFPFDQILKLVHCFQALSFGSRAVNKHWPRNAIQSYLCALYMGSIRSMSIHEDMKSDRSHWGGLYNISSQFSASEQHDRVFALLEIVRIGVAAEEIPESILPDYRKPIAELYRDATRFFIKLSRQDYILTNICHRSESDVMDDEKVSWTYPWAMARGPMDPGPLDKFLAYYPRAKTFMPVETGDPNILAVAGFTIEPIDWITPITLSTLDNDSRLDDLASKISAILGRCNEIFGSSEEAKHAACQALTAGSIDPQSSMFDSFEEKLGAFEAFLLEIRKDVWEIQTFGPSPASKFMRELTQAHNRCVFTTGDGYVGVGPKIIRLGDVPAIFVGGSVSYVLRPLDSLYRLVGPAFVHNLDENHCSTGGREPTTIELH